MSHFEQDQNDINDKVQKLNADKADKEYVRRVEDGVIDISNRVRRNTVIIHNVPEGSEGEETGYCLQFAREFFEKHMHIEGTGPGKYILVERAYRQPMGPRRMEGQRPRPIHAKLVLTADRNNIQQKAKNLKDNPYKGNRIWLMDSLHPETLKIHKKLVEKRKNY